MTPLEEMNRILSEKEKKIDEKMQALKNYKQELRAFESQLSEKVKEVKQAQEEIKVEKERLKKGWEELKASEKQLESSMSQVLAEKVQIEEKNLLELDALLEQEQPSEFHLDDLKQSVGIVPNFGTEEEKKGESDKERKEQEKGKQIPEIFLELEKEIQKSCPKWEKLELLQERYCLQNKDKEIRFFDVDTENPVPRVEIIVFRKNAKNDRRLQSNIASIGRVALDWNIVTEENQMICIMQFSPETNPSVVLKKCNEFIKNYLA